MLYRTQMDDDTTGDESDTSEVSMKVQETQTENNKFKKSLKLSTEEIVSNVASHNSTRSQLNANLSRVFFLCESCMQMMIKKSKMRILVSGKVVPPCIWELV